MDPYLEHPAHWEDFHSKFINYWQEALLDSLPPHYTARVQDHVYLIEGPPPSRRTIKPDVSVQRERGGDSGGGVAVASATLAPVTIPLIMPEPVRDPYIEVLYRPDRSLVAVLELLSPSNKEEPGYSIYLAKRDALILRNVHLVELDLLRGGHRLPLRDKLPAGDYYYLVSRGNRRPDCEVFAWSLPDPLPKLPVPLRDPDPDLVIDYAALFAHVFERGRYTGEIDYAQPPPVPLADDMLKWVGERIQAVQH
jgi:hypothetical protein